MIDNNKDANDFLNSLDDCFITQNVIKPTFQKSLNDYTNVLDLILTESPNRLYSLMHESPIGDVNKGHHVLTFNYSINSISENMLTKEDFNFNAGDYVNMNKYFSEINWSKEFFNLDADQCYNRFLEIYNYACERFIPVFKSKSKRKRAIWMNNELMKLIKLKREMWFKCLNCRFQSIDIVNDYKKIRTLVKEKVKIAVRDYEKDLVLNVKENPKRFYSYINKKIKVKDYIKALIDSSGNVTSDSKCIANILNNYFSSVFTIENRELPVFATRCEQACIDPTFVDDIGNRLNDLDIKKSPGVDRVRPIVLCECSEGLKLPIKIIFEESFITGIIPEMWLNANITAIYKKGDKLEPSNYRPISLTSVVSKIMEKILRDTIINHFSNFIIKEQHGFTKNKNCITNLLETLDLVSQALEESYSVDLAYLDFAKAFDTVPHSRLGLKLERYGIRGDLLRWCMSFLTNRVQRVVHGDSVSDWSRVLSGVPQGSVLGPLMFVIYILMI